MGKPDQPAPAPAEEPKRDEVRELIRGNLEQLDVKRKARQDAEAGLRAEGRREVAAAGKVLKKAEKLGKPVDKFSGGWKDATEVSDPSFQAGEKRILTGNIVNFRKADPDDSGVMARLSRGAEFTVAVDPAKPGQPKILEKGGERFVLVTDTKNRTGYVAAAYLKPFPERVAVTKEKKGRVEITDEKMFRELILHKLEAKFPGEQNKGKRDALYAKWDQGYQHIMRTKRDQPARDEALQRLYASIDLAEKGIEPDLYADKVKMELELALGARRAGTTVEVPAGMEKPEDALNHVLAQLGYEIGIYYGRGRMSVAQIREAFNIKGTPQEERRGQKWGEPGSRVVFNYTDGRLYFYPPESKKEMRTVQALMGQEHRAVIKEEAPGGIRQEEYDRVMNSEAARRARGERILMRVEEQELAMRMPQDAEMKKLAAERSREYIAALNAKKAKEAGV